MPYCPMAKILYWITRQRDGYYTVETTVRGVHQQSQSGFPDVATAQEWAEGQQAAGGGMDQWERQPDMPSNN